MLHFSCDVCGRQLDEQRFVVKVEAYPAFDPDEIDEDDLDADHLSEIADVLNQMDETGDRTLDDCGSKEFRFDLCPDCHGRYVKDPLRRDSLRRFNFSEN